MSVEVVDLRKGERFLAVEPITGMFGTADMSIANVSLAGMQIIHAQPVRLGTRARTTFRHGEINVAIQARIIWSHLSRTPDHAGKLLYVSGLRIENADPQYAAAINALFRAGVIRPDRDSMERKRLLVAEREKARHSAPKVIPTGGGV